MNSVPERTPLMLGLIRTARPKQWAKNVLVFAAPAAAGVVRNREVAERATLAFVVFCLAASGLYFLNDAADVESDRQHPKKSARPMAAGIVPLGVGIALGLILITAGLGLAFVLSWKVAALVGGYIVQTIAYSLWLKHVPVLDLATVAAGFVIRAIAGGLATDLPLSNWFLIVTGAGSLFMVTGKRFAELQELGGAPTTRNVLAQYSREYLRSLMTMSAAVAITGYALFAFAEHAGTETSGIWYQLSVVPFVLALMRYSLVVDHGGGGAPEEVVLSDRVLQAIGFVWAITFALAVQYG